MITLTGRLKELLNKIPPNAEVEVLFHGGQTLQISKLRWDPKKVLCQIVLEDPLDNMPNPDLDAAIAGRPEEGNLNLCFFCGIPMTQFDATQLKCPQCGVTENLRD